MKYYKKGDIIIITFLIVASFLPHVIFAYKNHIDSKNLGATKYTIVKINGKEIERFALDSPNTVVKTYYPSSSQYNIIEIRNGQARVKEDNSPNQIAVRTGWISKPGQTSICLPHKFVLEIFQEGAQDYYIY